MLNLSASVLLLSCTDVHIQDHEWCGDMGVLGASCFHTLSEKTRDIDKDTWDVERLGKLCTAPESFANLKAAILKLCDETQRCTLEQIETLKTLSAKIERIEIRSEVIGELRPIERRVNR